MAREIERKYLLKSDAWRALVTQSARIVQGYLGGDACLVRVRIKADQAFLTIKSREKGLSREEFEYPIPVADAERMLQMFAGLQHIEKTRHIVPHGALQFEIDQFAGRNAGLIVAELELPDEQTVVDLPDWIGAEVTHDPRYLNSNLLHGLQPQITGSKQ
jgi:adenylate cyclase